AIGITLIWRPSTDSGTVDMHGDPAALDPGTMPAPAQTKAMRAVEATGHRFRVPSVGLDVPLGALTMVDKTITPPGITSAYRVRNLGVPLRKAARGTVFVAMHSLHDGVGPGNYLIDEKAGTARVKPG